MNKENEKTHDREVNNEYRKKETGSSDKKSKKNLIDIIKKIDITMVIIILVLIIIILLLRSCSKRSVVNGTVDIPGNIIDPMPFPPPSVATSIELTYKKGYDNIPFKIEKMLPGDAISQYYCVSITHDSKKKVRFGVIFDLTEKLSSVMMIKVEQLVPDNADVVLYDGLMKEFVSVDIDVASSDNKISELYYRVTVYTIGSEVGNEYVGESLEVDFTWQIC